jgi:hypothetical protein
MASRVGQSAFLCRIVGHSHLKPVREQCIDLLRRDMSISAHQYRHRGQLLRNLGLLRSEERSSQLRLKCQLSHSLPEITRAYLGWLLADLRDALERNDSAAVGHLASALATELLSVGWSQRALYELRDLLAEVLASETGWPDFESMLSRPKRRVDATASCVQVRWVWDNSPEGRDGLPFAPFGAYGGNRLSKNCARGSTSFTSAPTIRRVRSDAGWTPGAGTGAAQVRPPRAGTRRDRRPTRRPLLRAHLLPPASGTRNPRVLRRSLCPGRRTAQYNNMLHMI